MKKRLLFLLPIASMALGGCALLESMGIGKKEDTEQKQDGDGKKPVTPSSWDVELEFESGTDEEKEAVLQAVNYLVPCMDAKSNDFFPNEDRELPADGEGGGSYVKLTKQIKVNGSYVQLEWGYDKTQGGYLSETDITEEHRIISLDYPRYGQDGRTFKWQLKKATYGSAVTKTVLDYSVTLKAEEHPHENISIAQINKVKEEASTHGGHNYPSTFELVNYDKESPYYFPNADDPNPNFRYVRVKGKVVYYAPDGNWLLLADGDQIAEVYAGSALNLKPTEYPAISNEYVEVSGNMSQYKGNIQVAYVTRIDPVDKSEVTEPNLSGVEITSDFISNNFELPSPYTCQKQAIDGFSNCIGKATGTIDTGSIKDSDGKTISASKVTNARFTFDIELSGGKKLTVAYDYHTDRDGKVGLFNKLKSKLEKGGNISIKGTMRYNGDNDLEFILDGNDGVWNLVPCTPEDID